MMRNHPSTTQMERCKSYSVLEQKPMVWLGEMYGGVFDYEEKRHFDRLASLHYGPISLRFQSGQLALLF